MASFLISSSASLTLTHTIPTRAFFRPPLVPNPPAIRFPGDLTRRRPRGLTVVTRAGPSTNSILFAIAIPLSLLTITFFASIKIADKLDRDYFEELAINQAIREAEEDEDEDEDEDDENEEDEDMNISLEKKPALKEEDEDINVSLEKEPALQRTRNRPKREV
ncbi:nucleosome assembly protein 1;3-like [Quercus lobata]|uniref:High chlorophyll fluorescence 153 n=1 Tax=Quercus lobata TaxID=97700 RepID=A0A7N2LCY0_QUELO|nr:nucleosome assembly protein 1;3-like [Quercus lobata]